MPAPFPASPPDTHVREGGKIFAPRFDANGLVTVVTTDVGDGAVLMVAHMNAEALARTLETGIAHYWSRSRNALWKKGETSGNLQSVVEMRTDCDQDAILLRVNVAGDGPTCHTGRRSCFYRVVSLDGGAAVLSWPPDASYAGVETSHQPIGDAASADSPIPNTLGVVSSSGHGRD